MSFAEALRNACLASAHALGADIKKLSWLMSNQPKADHVEKEKKAA
jgi:hypothetical protein